MPIDTISNLRTRLNNLKVTANTIKNEVTVGLNSADRVGSQDNDAAQLILDCLDTIINLLSGIESITDIEDLVAAAQQASYLAGYAASSAEASENIALNAENVANEAIESARQETVKHIVTGNDNFDLSEDKLKNLNLEIDGSVSTGLNLSITFTKQKSGFIFVQNNATGVGVDFGTANELGTFDASSNSKNMAYYFWDETSLFLKWN